ncbi:SPOR domain-containing protein [Streptomyces sp. NPDC014894]|uniref:SPOR domain-containing protein n=1 Tax=unclassified Streptomyces TaxID=2593676 RepID=UPI003703068A
MNDGSPVLPWLVIRQDGNGNCYRVGRYSTEEEARRMADTLDVNGDKRLYWVERAGRATAL